MAYFLIHPVDYERAQCKQESGIRKRVQRMGDRRRGRERR